MYAIRSYYDPLGAEDLFPPKSQMLLDACEEGGEQVGIVLRLIEVWRSRGMPCDNLGVLSELYRLLFELLSLPKFGKLRRPQFCHLPRNNFV